jgi:hypothetical protein
MEVAVTPPASDATGSPAEQGVVPNTATRFISIHDLLMRVDNIEDLPEGSIWVRDENDVLQQRSTKDIPPDRMPALKDSIAAGLVYTLWGHRCVHFEELGPEWPYAQQKLANLNQATSREEGATS